MSTLSQWFSVLYENLEASVLYMISGTVVESHDLWALKIQRGRIVYGSLNPDRWNVPNYTTLLTLHKFQYSEPRWVNPSKHSRKSPGFAYNKMVLFAGWCICFIICLNKLHKNDLIVTNLCTCSQQISMRLNEFVWHRI